MSRPALTHAVLVVSFWTCLVVPQTEANEDTVAQADANDDTVPQADANEDAVPQTDASEDAVPQADANDETQSPESPSSAEAGAAAFTNHCTECHNAQTSMRKTKSFADWLATVRRMAKKEDANIPNDVHEEIARYLALARQGNSRHRRRRRSPARQMRRPAIKPLRDGDDKKTKETGSSGKGFDASLVQAGETAFNSYCISCHDAQKSLQASKNLAGWRTTVRRMAGKPNAQIPENVHESIATYLASRNEGGNGKKEGGGSGADGGSQFSFTGTFSPLWRGGAKALQDPGFFPSLWVGAAWQGEGPVSARATACTTCHSESKFDLVEAAVRFDVTKYLRSRCNREKEDAGGRRRGRGRAVRRPVRSVLSAG